MAHYLKERTGVSPEAWEEIRATVSEILSAVEREGEAAVRRYSVRFDGWSPERFRVSQDEILAAQDALSDELREHVAFTQAQVRNFAELQRSTLVDMEWETLPGVTLGQRFLPVASVGAYSPGGLYPLIASAIMTVVTPRVAGVERVVACAPPRDPSGMHPPQLYAMATSGADEIFCIGGVQAFAAMAFGIEDLEPTDMLIGAGNAYVAEAKRQLFGTVGIDLLAGPTEVMVLADDTGDPDLVAADLLGQAEHGPTSPATLITTSERLGREVADAVDRWLEGEWPTKDVAGTAWRDHGAIIVCEDDEEAAQVADEIAPEHLEIHTEDPDQYLKRLGSYGTLFLGTHATVAYSDKSIGTNHVLPTRRAARYTGGLWVGKFLKTVTYQRVSAEGSARVAATAAAISDAELMFGHALTARLRLDPERFPDAMPAIPPDESIR
ncbi:MAG TPA: histidinol dehydrogenase [Actinomycetota bacterium]|nr:histidinol dehydrogenase [Actinomycetota bacterium]